MSTTEFGSGASEEIRWVETGQHDVTSADPMVVIPHGGNPSGPFKQYSRGPTDEVTADLTVNDNVARNFTVAMTVQNVIRYGCHDLPMQQVAGNYWTVSPFDTGVLTTLSTVATGNKFHAASGTPFSGLSALVPCPVWICRGGGTPITGRPVIAKAVLSGGADLQIETAANNGITLTDVAAGPNVQIMVAGVLKNGVEHIFALMERAMTILGHFHGGFGMIGTSLQFSGQKGQDPTWQIQFQGVDSSIATATFGSGSFTAAPTWKPFNFGSDFKHFREGGTLLTGTGALAVHQLQWTLQSGVTAIDPAGQDGPYAHQKNRYQLNGSVNYYTNDAAKDVAAKASSKTDSSIFYALQRTEGSTTNAYVPWIPLVQYENAQPDGGGAESALMTNTTWQSAKSPTYGCQFCLARFTGVPLTLT